MPTSPKFIQIHPCKSAQRGMDGEQFITNAIGRGVARGSGLNVTVAIDPFHLSQCLLVYVKRLGACVVQVNYGVWVFRSRHLAISLARPAILVSRLFMVDILSMLGPPPLGMTSGAIHGGDNPAIDFFQYKFENDRPFFRNIEEDGEDEIFGGLSIGMPLPVAGLFCEAKRRCIGSAE